LSVTCKSDETGTFGFGDRTETFRVKCDNLTVDLGLLEGGNEYPARGWGADSPLTYLRRQ